MPRAPWRVEHFESLPSTNLYARDSARAGAPAGLVVVADHQSAGRGRLGRTWEAPPGASLLVSVLLRPALPPSSLHLCSTVVALSAADACASVAGVEVGVKWPNDLMAGGRKLAGVLAEVVTGPSEGAPAPPGVVVGLGLNIEWPGPPEAEGTSLRRLTGRAVARDELLDAFLDVLGERTAAIGARPGEGAPDGPAALEAAGEAVVGELRARCVTLGRRVRVELADGTIEGMARDIADDGRLVVDTRQGARQVDAGDVVHVRPSPATGAPGGDGGPVGGG
ncbi:MAG TPA: biotin--[acetyl-CoA-carboxylase] ligase [Acidimicrobiales bacterium]|jgi:BirA family biotin operon repressor/biotin-[acetyl-CoA-carboxylase] ligase